MVFVLRWESGIQKEQFIGVSSLRHLLSRIDKVWCHPIRISKEMDQWIITIMDIPTEPVEKPVVKKKKTKKTED